MSLRAFVEQDVDVAVANFDLVLQQSGTGGIDGDLVTGSAAAGSGGQEENLLIGVPGKEAVSGIARPPGSEGQPPLLGVCADVIDYDVPPAAAAHIGVENRAPVPDLGADRPDFARVEVPVAEHDLGVSLGGGQPDHGEEQTRYDHRSESDQQRISGVDLRTSGDGHSSSGLFAADCVTALGPA